MWKSSWMSKAILLLTLILVLFGPLVGSASAQDGPPGSSIEDLLEELLRRYDTNGDGKLDPAERVRMWLDIFRDVDPSVPTNVMTEEQFVRWLMRMGYNENTARNLWLMLKDEADTNGDGVISIKEWTEFLRRHKLVLVFVTVAVDPDEINELLYPMDLFPWIDANKELKPYSELDFLSNTPPPGTIEK